MAARIVSTPSMPLPLLAALVAVLGLSACSLLPGHHDDDQKSKEPPPPTSEEAPGEVIDPNIARRDVKVPKIKASNFEVGAYGGILSVQDLGAHFLWGGRAAYHITEDFWLEGEYGHSQVSDQVRRAIGQPFFPQQVVSLSSYGVNLGYNLMPGEVFAGSRYAMNSVLYLLAGAGNTSFNSEDFLTYNVGFGIKVLPLDWLSVRLEGRDRLWESDVLGDKKLTNNLEATLGFAVFFGL